ncbi:hypothetical protein K0U27_02035 [archaeon]|nr:hypothetical protein [archaeon]
MKSLLKKGEAKLIFIGIVISAYMAMSYDIIRELIENPNADITAIAIAGIVSLGVGGGLFYLFVRGTIK